MFFATGRRKLRRFFVLNGGTNSLHNTFIFVFLIARNKQIANKNRDFAKLDLQNRGCFVVWGVFLKIISNLVFEIFL